MTVLVLLLANGWMTRFLKYDIDSKIEIYLPLFAFVVIVHIIMGAMTFKDQDQYHKYHDFSGFVGCLLIFSKLILTGAFLYLYIETKPTIKQVSQEFF